MVRRPDDSLDDVVVGVNEILAVLCGLSSVACVSSGKPMPRRGAVPHRRLPYTSADMVLQRCWPRFRRSRTVEISRTPRRRRPRARQLTGFDNEKGTAPIRGVDNAPPRD